jgi:transcriptional regulator with XRE-family HTH domain
MAQAHTRTVKARRLGAYLRRMREDYGLQTQDVARRLEVSHMTVRRIEQGLSKTDLDTLDRLFDVYDVAFERRKELANLAAEAFRSGWWIEYGDVLHGVFAVLEDEASKIRSFQSQLVPGILQIDAYARAVFQAAISDADGRIWQKDTVEKQVLARRTRRAILDRPDPPELHVVMSEAVLHQEIGGPEAMAEQLAHIARIGQRENVTVQVLPYRAGAHAGLEGPFILFEFEHPDDPDVVHTENLSGSAYSETPGAVKRFRLAWGSVVDAALPSQESVAMIAALATAR